MNVLLVDDRSEIRFQVLDTWSKEPLNVTAASSTSEANAYLSQQRFDVAIVDLNLDDAEGEFSGIPFAAKLRASNDDILIVMYSAYIERGQEENELAQNCKKAGADHVQSRTWVVTSTREQIIDDLTTWRASRLESLRSHLEVEIDGALPMLATVELLGGEDIVHDIIRTLLPNDNWFSVEALGGGYSDAVLMRVSAARTSRGAVTSRNVIKASRSQFSLAAELRSKPFSGTPLDRVGVAPRADSVKQVGDWYVFCVRDVVNSMTLEKYLLESRNKALSTNTLRLAVEDALAIPARSSWKQGSGKFELSDSFLAQVSSSIRDSKRFCKLFATKEQTSEVVRLEEYLKGVQGGYYSLGSTALHVANLHGDFHARNVLVQNDSAVAIDFGRSDVYPRMFDYACLDADLICRVVESDTGKHWDPRGIKRWWKEVSNQFPLDPEGKYGFGLIGKLRQELHRSVSALEFATPREYAIALLFHLLRYLRFESIPMPKRALGAIWAGKLVEYVGR